MVDDKTGGYLGHHLSGISTFRTIDLAKAWVEGYVEKLEQDAAPCEESLVRVPSPA